VQEHAGLVPWTNDTGQTVTIKKALVHLGTPAGLFADVYAHMVGPSGEIIQTQMRDHYTNDTMTQHAESRADGSGFPVDPGQSVSLTVFCERFSPVTGHLSVVAIGWYTAEATGALRTAALRIGPTSCGPPTATSWTNTSGCPVKIRRTQIFVGHNGSFYNYDTWASLSVLGTLASWLSFNHYAPFSGPHEARTQFFDDRITVQPGDQLTLTGSCAPVNAPGNDVIYGAIVWYEP
jgi:hypothetical protein